jgi:hypothetical protein
MQALSAEQPLFQGQTPQLRRLVRYQQPMMNCLQNDPL